MSRCEISERTLELNVCCSIIEELRRHGWREAYIEGYTLRHEGIHGLDVSFKIPYSTELFALQFKKPLKCLGLRCSERTYVFSINNNERHDQHLLLLLNALALKLRDPHRPPCIFYALPLVCNTYELERKINFILWETLFVDVLDVPFVGFRSCELRAFTTPLRNPYLYFRCSSKKEVKFFSWYDILENIERMTITAKKLQEIAEVDYEELEKALTKYLKENAIPDSVINEVVDYIRREQMEQLVTAVALRKGERRVNMQERY